MRVFATAAVIISLMVPSVSLAAPAANPVTPAAPAPAKKKLPAPTPERLALAHRIIDAQGGAENFSAIFDAFLNGVLKGLKPSPQVMVIAAPYQERLTRSLHAHMPRIIDATAVAWARTYDEEELKAQAAYWESPTSRGLMAKFPALLADLGQELGWFGRQIMLTDPKLAQYLADVGKGEEAPLAWPVPPQASMDAIRARIAATPGGEKLLHPEDLLEKAPGGSKAKGRSKGAPPSAAEKRALALLPTLINDVLAILANHVTPEEIDAQKAFSESPAGKATELKSKSLMDMLTEDLKPILMEIGHDVMTPPQTT